MARLTSMDAAAVDAVLGGGYDASRSGTDADAGSDAAIRQQRVDQLVRLLDSVDGPADRAMDGSIGMSDAEARDQLTDVTMARIDRFERERSQRMRAATAAVEVAGAGTDHGRNDDRLAGRSGGEVGGDAFMRRRIGFGDVVGLAAAMLIGVGLGIPLLKYMGDNGGGSSGVDPFGNGAITGPDFRPDFEPALSPADVVIPEGAAEFGVQSYELRIDGQAVPAEMVRGVVMIPLPVDSNQVSAYSPAEIRTALMWQRMARQNVAARQEKAGSD